MPITVEWQETESTIRLEGDLNITCATELKSTLLKCLASGKTLMCDLRRAETIDVSILQLLWTAGREAARAGTGIASRWSEAAALAAKDAGFETFLAPEHYH